MTIRKKIALWITGAGVLVSLVFSLVIFLEMLEQPYEIIDRDLKATARTVVRMIADHQNHGAAFTPDILPLIGGRYWFKVYAENGNPVYQSYLTRFVNLPIRVRKSGYTVSTHIPRERIELGQDPRDEVTFRVRVVRVDQNGTPYRVHIGMPMEKFQEETADLLIAIGIALAVSLLFLVLVSYLVAGRILKPVGTINSLAREINEKTLDRRIPVGESIDELSALSETLNRMFDRLQHSFSRQKQFIADASHELKTPITLLRLFAEESMHRQDLSESFRQRLIKLSATIFRMDRLVKNLLDLSALEHEDKLELSDFSLSEVVKTVMDEFYDLILAKKIHFKANLSKTLRVRADREKLRRVLVNILDNAVKYNRKGGEIILDVSETDGTINISLTNTGPGIPESDLARVFEQFYRVEKSRSLKLGGAGLGLTIVRRIVELHGGRVAIESKPGAWTTITVYLPKNQVG